MTIDTIIRTISLILAPVVMITSCAIFLNGLLSRYDSISARMRTVHHERLELLENLANKGSSSGHSLGFSTQRIREIEVQHPSLLLRHKMIRYAVLVVDAAILILVISMFIIAASALSNSTLIAIIALFTFLIGTAALLAGVIITTLELSHSEHEVVYEVQHGLSLKKEDLTE